MSVAVALSSTWIPPPSAGFGSPGNWLETLSATSVSSTSSIARPDAEPRIPMWKMPPAANIDVLALTCDDRNVGDESWENTPPPAPLLPTPAPPVPEALPRMSQAAKTGREPETIYTPPPKREAE